MAVLDDFFSPDFGLDLEWTQFISFKLLFCQTLDLSSNMALDTETALLLAKGRKYLNKNFEF